MKLTLLQEKKQPLLSRKELTYVLDQGVQCTPSKTAVKKLIAGHLKVDEKLLVLHNVMPTFGNPLVRVTVDVYDTASSLQKFSFINKKKLKGKASEEKKPAEPVKEEKPAEQPKPEEKKEAA